MAGEFSPTNSIIKSEAATAGFVPDLWSDEISATYKKNLVAANLVKKLNVKGKRGDSITVPKPVRGAATSKAAETPVTLIQETGTGVVVALDQHWHYARMIEDIAEMQSLPSLRKFYTEDAGYALAAAIDTVVLQQFRKVKGGDGTVAYNKAVIGSDGSTDYSGSNEAALTDVALRRVIQTLDDNDVPMNDRFLIIPPVSRNTLMGLARFTEQAFVGEGGSANVIRNGRLGNVYGVEIFVTSLCETATGDARIAVLGHKEAVVLAEQMSPRVQTQKKLEFIGDLLVADTVFGAQELRNEAAVAIAVAG